jgi:hypothetical protein
MPGVQLADRHHHRCCNPRRAGPAAMPLLSLVGVRRWLGARQRLLAPELTVVGPASQAGAAIHGAVQQVPSLARSVLQPRRDRPFAKAREPVDGRGGAVDGLRLGGCPVGLDRVVAEVVCAALGHRVVLDEGREHQVRCDQVIDHIPHGPFSARRRRIPLVWPDVGNQIGPRPRLHVRDRQQKPATPCETTT